MRRARQGRATTELSEVFASIEAFVRAAGVDPRTSLAEDSTSLCRYRLDGVAVEPAIASADSLTQAGADLVMSLDTSNGHVQMRTSRTGVGLWEVSGDLDEIGWPNEQDVDEIDKTFLVRHWRSTNLVTRAVVEIVLDKSPWSASISAETGRTVWVGSTQQGFERWLTERPPDSTLGVILAEHAALVLLADWPGAAVELGPNLSFGNLDHRAAALPTEAPWPEESEPWQRRSVLIDIENAPGELRPRLARAVGWSAALLIAEEHEGDQLRPDRNSTTTWNLPGTGPDGVPAVVSLARWVSQELSITRLQIARTIAAVRLVDPFAGHDQSVLEAADIAYRQTVDSLVQAALLTQLELERSFRSMDAEFTTVRAHLVETLDQTLLRGAAGLVAIGAAAAASKQKSPSFILFGSLLVAAYVLFTATVQLAMAKRDLKDRLDAFQGLISSRGQELASDSLDAFSTWREHLRIRLLWMRWSMTAVAVVVAAGGLLVARNLDDRPMSPPKPNSTTTTTNAVDK